VSEKELTPEERLAQQHIEIYTTINAHFHSLRRLLTVAIESIDASIKILEINPDVVSQHDDKP
jgi:hypothetical protein